MTTLSLSRVARASLLIFAVAACSKKDAEPAPDTTPAPAPPANPTVSTIELGRRIGSDKRVTDTTSVFARRDTIYLAVVTDNTSPTTNLTARWSFVSTGQVVDSTAQAVAPSASAGTVSVTEFHIAKPSGWPPGKYKVDVTMDGQSVGSREFEVRR